MVFLEGCLMDNVISYEEFRKLRKEQEYVLSGECKKALQDIKDLIQELNNYELVPKYFRR